MTDNTAQVSTIVDTANFGSCELVGVLGTNADSDATYTVLVEDGDASNLSDAAAVADEHLLGVEAMGLDFADDGATFKIGYIGPKRYVRVTVTPGSNTGNVFLGGAWIQGHPRNVPQSTQVN
ncbi:MAG TPA: hypothetical protein VEA69_21170 [Tepidisphaeraceae bacterium]|nr:hypothetical protein [Tepidisphaeraceae bacterium]